MPDGRALQLEPLAQDVTRRFLAEFPDERDRHGDAAEEWCLHDNQYLLAWAVEDLRLRGRFAMNVNWLAGVLRSREYPLERLERDLELAADVLAAAAPAYAAELAERFAAATSAVRAAASGDAAIAGGELRRAYLSALLDAGPADARRVVEEAADGGLPVRTIYLEVLQPALYEVGELWASGRMTVAEEHLATATTQVLLARLAPRLRREPRVERRAVVTSAQGELHALGARFVADFLEGDGWTVLELGASTPADALVGFVRDARPHVVAISTTLTTNLEASRDVVSLLRGLPDPPVVAVGGRAYGGDEEIARRVGADVFAADAGALADMLRRRFDEP